MNGYALFGGIGEQGKRRVVFADADSGFIIDVNFKVASRSAFAFDYYVNGIYYRKVTQQLPGGGCGETHLIVVNDDYQNTYSGDVVIPETETINGESYRVRYIGSEAFYGCINLTDINDHVHIVVPCNCIEAFEAAEEWQGILLYDDCGNVGVGEAETAALSIYPNPASEKLTIEAEGPVTIVDETGRVVKTLFVRRKETISLDGLSSGFYFVKAGNLVKKIMVK